MQLTRNERKTLLFLLQDGRASDTEISDKLGISKQAVGKIRKKLEKTGVIKGYHIKLDYERLGIHAFAIVSAVLTKKGAFKGDLEVESKLLENSNIIKAFRVPSGDITHILIYGFENLEKLTNYFHASNDDELEVKQVHVCSHIGFLKDDSSKLLMQFLDDSHPRKYKSRYAEIDRFKNDVLN